MSTCNVENMRLFIDALRSGEYKQTTGRLRASEADARYSYCCLGVATDVAIKHGVVVGGGEIWPSFATLPFSVREWLGIDEDNPTLGRRTFTRASGGEGVVINATGWNDVAQATFPEIADAFEAEFITSNEEVTV